MIAAQLYWNVKKVNASAEKTQDLFGTGDIKNVEVRKGI